MKKKVNWQVVREMRKINRKATISIKRQSSKKMGIMRNRKKSEKISLVCISFRRVQGREMKK